MLHNIDLTVAGIADAIVFGVLRAGGPSQAVRFDSRHF